VRVRLETTPVASAESDAAGKRGYEGTRYLVAHLAREREHARIGDPCRKYVRTPTGRDEHPRVEYWRLNLPRTPRGPASARRLEHERDRRLRDGDDDLVDLVRLDVDRERRVAPSEPWM
jgi:hypothetical protein